MNRYLNVALLVYCIIAIVKMNQAASVIKPVHQQNESAIRDTDAMLHKIDSEIGQIRQKIDSLTNIEHDEEDYTRKFNSYLIFAEFLLSVIAMVMYMVVWERRRARNYDAIQNNAELQDNAGDMNYNGDNLLIV